MDGRPGDALEPLVAKNLSRIAHEAVGNAVRHSGARRSYLVLAHGVSTSGIRLSVEDDGAAIGAEQRLADGLGLRIRRARAKLIGAVLRVGRPPPQGARIECVWEGPLAGRREPGGTPAV